MLIEVYDDEILVENRHCRIVQLPTKEPGAIWRGLAYPVRDGRIYIDRAAFVPGECLEGVQTKEEAETVAQWEMIEGLDDAYLVLGGSIIDAENVAVKLRKAGLNVRRLGRYLGDPIDNFIGDWFVRFDNPYDETNLRALLETIIGSRTNSSAPRTEGTSTQRERLLMRELQSTRAERDQLQNQFASLALKTAEAEGRSREELAELQRSFAEERKQWAATDRNIVVEPTTTERPQAAIPAKIKDEILATIKALLPRVEILRDSLTYISAEMHTRAHLYRALDELHAEHAGMPAAWKKLKGLNSWWERHVSTGQDDTGRIYARPDPETKKWMVLISHKLDQSRDIQWLRRRDA